MSVVKINKALLKDLRKAVVWSYTITRQASGKLLASVITCFLLEALIPVAFTATIGIIVAKFKSTTKIPFSDQPLPLLMGIAIALLALELILKEIRAFSRTRLAEETAFLLQKVLFKQTSRMDLVFFETKESLNLLFRAAGGKSAFGPIQCALSCAGGLIQLGSLFSLMFYLSPLMAFYLFLAGLPLIIIRCLSSLQKFNIDVKRTEGKRLSGYYTSLLTGSAIVTSTKLLNLAAEMIGRFETTAREIIQEKQKILITITLKLTAAIIFYLLILLSVISWLANKFENGMLEAAVIVAFLLASFRALKSNTQISKSLASGAESALRIIPLLEFLSEEPKISDEGGLCPESLNGNISFKDLEFSYPGSLHPVIDKLSLEIPAGQKVAIVGRNGAGKTTLIKLIARLYEADNGTIHIDGNNIKDLSLRWLHDHIALCFQRPVQFEATVQENIAFGDWHKLKDDPVKVQKLADETGIIGFVKDLPSGMDTHLGRLYGEVTISTGQWQLLAITRELARKDSILILD